MVLVTPEKVRIIANVLKLLHMDDLPVLATCQSGTSAILSSKVNGPVAQGSIL